MSSDDKNDLAVSVVKALADQLPIKDFYNDGLSQSVGEAGGMLSDILKTVRLALAPFQVLGAYQDRFKSFLDRSIRRVPEQSRISPPTQILGPVLEGIRYEPEGTQIDEMFSELLARSMDVNRASEAHPSYPYIIKQISSDEAKVLQTLLSSDPEFVYTLDFDANTATFSNRKVELDKFPIDGLQFPENLEFYIEHLRSLGLAGIFQQGNQEPISIKGVQTGIRARCNYRLTELGRKFVSACTSR